jgi:hypothetical protein
MAETALVLVLVLVLVPVPVLVLVLVLVLALVLALALVQALVQAPSHSSAPRCCPSLRRKQLPLQPRRTTARRAAVQVWNWISSEPYSVGLFSIAIR